MYRSSNPNGTDRTTWRRGRVLAALFILAGLGVVVRLVQLQLVEYGHWRAAAAAVQERVVELPPRRGTILDRSGTLLAVDVKAMAVAVDGINVTRPEVLAAVLSEELDVSLNEVQDLVNRPRYFTWIDRHVDLETALRIEEKTREANASGLIFVDTWKRCYPQGRLASNVIGFVGIDGMGLEGIELAFDHILRGTPSTLHIVKGADGRTYHSEIIEPGQPGRDIVLTIDAKLQFICEEEIERGVARFRADGGMLVVIAPYSGEVLAMAQDKGYDLNRFPESTVDQRRNLSVCELFEPGSSFKVFAGLAALDSGVVSAEHTFDGDDGIFVSGHVMHNAENRSFGEVTFAEIIENSINTGMIRVAQRLGEEQLCRFLGDLEFGCPTGIELPGEEEGILRDVRRWSPIDLAAASIGQSVAVTGIQLARATAVIANGGLLLQPSIVRSVGENAWTREKVSRRVASEEACATMRELMRSVVVSGTGTLAAVEGFSVAGKTGTAQKAVPGRGYVDGRYTSLFAGFLPSESPRFVAIVVLDEVKTTPVWGGYTAGQIFREAATRMVHHEGISPTVNR
jgi:cell division protein FtsI (penicillin-binding protein 3)